MGLEPHRWRIGPPRVEVIQGCLVEVVLDRRGERLGFACCSWAWHVHLQKSFRESRTRAPKVKIV